MIDVGENLPKLTEDLVQAQTTQGMDVLHKEKILQSLQVYIIHMINLLFVLLGIFG